MGQTVSSGAGAPMERSVIGSKDASALQNAKGSSVRKKVKQGNTVVMATFSTSEPSFLESFLPPKPKIFKPLLKVGKTMSQVLKESFLILFYGSLYWLSSFLLLLLLFIY